MIHLIKLNRPVLREEKQTPVTIVVEQIRYYAESGEDLTEITFKGGNTIEVAVKAERLTEIITAFHQ